MREVGVFLFDNHHVDVRYKINSPTIHVRILEYVKIYMSMLILKGCVSKKCFLHKSLEIFKVV